jgi:hypothetical protein
MAKELVSRGPPVSFEKAHTKSSERITGMHPKLSTSYIRFEEGESPMGMGQNIDALKP